MVASACKPSKCELDFKFKKLEHLKLIFQLLQALPKHKNRWQHCVETLLK
jgi:hypothetical protein